MASGTVSRIRSALGRRLRRSRDTASHGVAKAKREPRPDTIKGYWLRVVPPVVDAEPATDREVNDPSEAIAVRAGWQLIDAYERLSTHGARTIFARELDAWHAYADETMLRLESSTSHSAIHQSPNNRVRYRRMMDFAQKGDRVFDVGFGQGYLAAQLIKGSGVASYHGIDIVDQYIPAVGQLFADNNLSNEGITLEIGDLYDLNQEAIKSADANLVICCEVLEHVPDAERALQVLAESLPEGADLVFSVPLIGRLEAVWGHVSVFGVARLKQMLDRAGLHAHHVEPLANAWALVVANRDPNVSERVRRANHRPPTRVEVPLSKSFDFLDVRPSDITAASGAVQVGAPDGNDRVKVELTGSGSVRFPAPGLEAMRFDFVFAEADALESVSVVARRDGSQTCRWTWRPKDPPRGREVVRVRPGDQAARFISSAHKQVHLSDEVEMFVTVRDGGSVDFDFRVSILP